VDRLSIYSDIRRGISTRPLIVMADATPGVPEDTPNLTVFN
jgi:hypothetical protein